MNSPNLSPIPYINSPVSLFQGEDTAGASKIEKVSNERFEARKLDFQEQFNEEKKEAIKRRIEEEIDAEIDAESDEEPILVGVYRSISKMRYNEPSNSFKRSIKCKK